MYLPKPSADFEPVPAGTYLGICVRVIDCGTQPTRFDGKFKHQVRLSWELPFEHMKDGRPFTISKTYSWTMHKRSSLRQHLEAWRGQPFAEKDFGPTGFNIRNVLGKSCMATVAQEERNGETFSFVSAIGKTIKGQKVPGAYNKLIYVWLDSQLFDRDAFESLHEKTREQIAKSPEYGAIVNGKPPPTSLADELDDEIL